MKPLSEGVYLIWTLPSFILQNKIKENKGEIKKMNKTDLIKNVSAQIEGATQKDVAVIVDTVLETIVNTVASGEKVSLAGFGNFEVAERTARKGRNPKTGEPLEIAASKSPKFHALTGFKNAVKNA